MKNDQTLVSGRLTRDVSALEKMVLLERFVNEGSPTGLTWKNSSSVATCPRKSARLFGLPLLRVSWKTSEVHGIIPDAFAGEDLLFPVHPDCVHLLDKDLHAQLIFEPIAPVMVMPTASPRTVFVNNDRWIGFLKLDYPFVLGRFERSLSGDKLKHGLAVSSLLQTQGAESQGVYHFPEIGAIEIQASADRRAGTLFRNGTPVGPHFNEYFTFCSLFGNDYFSPITSNRTILIELAHQYGGLEWIANCIFLPLLKSFWQLVTDFGLWPEAHAQNIVLGVNTDGRTGIIWRDGQGFWVDEQFSHNVKEVCRGRVISIDDDGRFRRRSFLYDWTLGHYVLDPLILAASEEYSTAQASLTRFVAEQTRALLGNISSVVLLPDEAFGMSLEEPRGRHLPLEKLREIRYR